MGNRQGSLFESTLFDMINVKPSRRKAFRQGKTWADEKRRENQPVRNRLDRNNKHRGPQEGRS